MIAIKMEDEKGVGYIVTLKTLAELCKIPGNVCSASVIMETGKVKLTATAVDRDPDPGISVDGEINGNMYYVASADVPHETPDKIVGRLYAGNTDKETDIPIVTVPMGDRDTDDEGRRIALYESDEVAMQDFNTKSGVLAGLSNEEIYSLTTEKSLTDASVKTKHKA